MRDTVELLEAIGRDASLRHASPEALARALEAADASAGLLELAANGDGTALTQELGLTKMQTEHMSQTGAHEDEEPEEGGEEPSERTDEPDDAPSA
ncbi:hypothetical protein [Luteibacter yeojuensis]|uniref:Uncharacterized protein n=1 Tax=Luteibacter yeojuensis TaxID=345309 RepID=A0A7X5TNI3_9GAMM|nr:hypothetical protein [Luteibacter yeojuensis]NID14090.1 hypothetical protein [Luteibacter yeojuensis]